MIHKKTTGPGLVVFVLSSIIPAEAGIHSIYIDSRLRRNDNCYS